MARTERRWLTRKFVPAVMVVTLLATGTLLSVAQAVRTPALDAGLSSKELVLHDRMRRLWEDHVSWTRGFIVSFAADLPDGSKVAARLLRNQDQIGAAFAVFYGQTAGDRLATLLRHHILTAVDVLTAAKAGDDAALQDALDRWYANARRIARFLHSLNPANWPLADLRSMMKEHLDLTLAEATDRLQGRFGRDIIDYAHIETEILGMADTFTDGIINQFPGKF